MAQYEYQKTHGAIVLDGKHIADTLQCVHCGSHEEIIPGSGRKRAFCSFCNMGFVCGKKPCMIHIPLEAKLDYADAKQINDLTIIRKLLSRYPLIERIKL